MTFLLWHRQAQISIASPRKVLRAAEIPVFSQANALCEHLQSLHVDEQARIDAACDEGRARGLADGFEEGMRRMSDAAAQQITELIAKASRDREALQHQVAELALQVARKIVGALADEDQLVALALTAARDMMPCGALTLVVHPDQADKVAQRLAAISAATAAGAASGYPSLGVRAEAECPHDACRLETDLGSVDASLATQLSRLATAWGVDPEKVLG